MSNPIVFISYSHDSDGHREQVLAFSERLRVDDVETRLDQYLNGAPEEGWPRWMLNHLVTRGSMRLHESDCHLESARLALATGDRASARKAWETAKAMVEEMGYHRRDEEVKEIERQLNAD